MKRKIYTCLSVAMLVASCLLSITVSAQNQQYWREGFDNDGPSSNPGAGSTVVDYAGTSGTWRFYGVYITTGTGCAGPGTTGSNRHIRSTDTSPDTAYVITPRVSFGIQELRWLRSRANRRLTVYKTSDTAITTTNWVLAYVQTKSTGIPVTLCNDTAIQINDANAKRLMIKFEIGQNNDLDSIGLTSVNVVTPVKFSTISAQQANGFTKVSWTILTETNTQKYEIERSTDGRNFSVVGSVSATNAGKYNWMDNTLINGTNFYRVRGVDKDGSATYSTIVKVASGKMTTELLVTPNPVQGHLLNLQLSNAEKGTYTLNLRNNAGALVFTKILENEGGAISRSVELPAGVAKGMYQLQVINGTTQLTRAIVVQ